MCSCYTLFPQFSVNFQNFENTRHFGSPPSLEEIGFKSGLWTLALEAICAQREA